MFETSFEGRTSDFVPEQSVDLPWSYSTSFDVPPTTAATETSLPFDNPGNPSLCLFSSSRQDSFLSLEDRNEPDQRKMSNRNCDLFDAEDDGKSQHKTRRKSEEKKSDFVEFKKRKLVHEEDKICSITDVADDSDVSQNFEANPFSTTSLPEENIGMKRWEHFISYRNCCCWGILI